MEQQMRKLRKINDVIKYIKSFDSESAVSRFMIERLVHDKDVYSITCGSATLVDLDEVLSRIGLIIS